MEISSEILLLFVRDWLEVVLRWVHVITAIAWVGSSFYFIALDFGLWRDRELPKGVHGEEWQVHGGGFYHVRKYLVAPKDLPEHLTWFKWESYATWLSGFALMVVIYYLGSDIYLIDPHKADLSTWSAISISLLSLVVGWLVYSALCRSPIGQNSTFLMIVLYLLIIGMSWGFSEIFTDRAAFLHLGAVTATIMSANVFLVIIPNQKIVVADLKAGRVPDKKYGAIAKQRSTHNNYLTLPVIFLMLSNHYPLAFATEYSWIIASLVFLMGVTIRHYFNSTHARSGNPRWTWGVTAIIFVVIMALSLAPLVIERDDIDDEAGWDTSVLEGQSRLLADHEDFETVTHIVMGRCSMCHAAEPYYEGFIAAPKGVLLETPVQIATQARVIVSQSALTHAMPPANVTYMESEERVLIRKWFEAVQ